MFRQRDHGFAGGYHGFFPPSPPECSASNNNGLKKVNDKTNGNVEGKSGRGRNGRGDGRSNEKIDLWKTFYELAGIVGIDPANLSLRDLSIMADAKNRSEWLRFGVLCSLTANINRAPKAKAFTPDDFMPYKMPKVKPIVDNKAAMAMLKAMAKTTRKAK